MDQVIEWLLGSGNPVIQSRTLVELLSRPLDDPEVLATQANIPSYPPILMLLDSQKPEGYWNQRDYYLPKHTGTFWVLSILGEMGLTNASENIRRGCEFMFSFQRTDGGFYRKGNFLGQDQVWDNRPEPCTHARIVRF